MNRKEKILFYTEPMGGGVFSYIVDLANELVDTFDVYIAHGIRPQTPKNYAHYFDKRIHLEEIKNFKRSINPIIDAKALKEMIEIKNKVQPDIIHLHSSKAGAIGRWAFHSDDIPVFYTPHGYSFLMEDCKKTKRLLYKFIEKLSSLRKSVTISCSQGEHRETLKLTSSAKYINNGINIDKMNEILNSVRATKSDKFTIFTLGRICYQKNPELFNEIAKQYPNVNFIWIGEGELINVLTAPNIHITGWVDRSKALEIAMSADAFLLTSRWEGLPISLLEAMYMKKICIVGNVIGNRDVIISNRNGYVCDSLEDYKLAIDTEMKKLSVGMIEEAYNDIKCEYNIEIMSSKYVEIYRNALNLDFECS